MMAAAVFILSVHLTWIVLVIVGAVWTRNRPVWTALHILALLWGIVVETGPWPCPLTLTEEFFEMRIGMAARPGGFLLRLLDATVYPDLPVWAITLAAVTVCSFNLGIYAWRLQKYMRLHARR